MPPLFHAVGETRKIPDTLLAKTQTEVKKIIKKEIKKQAKVAVKKEAEKQTGSAFFEAGMSGFSSDNELEIIQKYASQTDSGGITAGATSFLGRGATALSSSVRLPSMWHILDEHDTTPPRYDYERQQNTNGDFMDADEDNSGRGTNGDFMDADEREESTSIFLEQGGIF